MVINRKLYILINFLNLEVKMEAKYNHIRETMLIEKSPSIFSARYDDRLTGDSLKLLKERYSETKVIIPELDFKAKHGNVKGCNFFYKAALSNIARELSNEDIIPMTQLISELFLNGGKLEDVNNTYEVSGFTNYPQRGANPKSWQHFRDQAKAYFPNIDLDVPFVVEGLMDVVKDDNYECGLRIDFNKDGLTIATKVPVLSKGNGKFSSKDPGLLKTGFPYELDKEGDRHSYTVDNGCRGFDRDGSGLDARNDDLAGSNGAGRVHLAKNFSGLNLEEIAKNESLIDSIRKNALERAAQTYEARKNAIETA